MKIFPRRCRSVVAILLLSSLLFTPGCIALALIGLGGAGGYLIRKGEEAPKRKQSSQSEELSAGAVLNG